MAERMEEEVLDKYKVEESKKGVLSEAEVPPLDWRRVHENKRYIIRKW